MAVSPERKEKWGIFKKELPQSFNMFSNNLNHQVERVFKQAENGMNVVIRIARHLKKVYATKKMQATEALTSTEVEIKGLAEQRKEAEEFAADAFNEATTVVLLSLREESLSEVKFANGADRQVITPLFNFHTDGELKRKKLFAQYERAVKDHQLKLAALTEQQKECVKAWQELKAAKILKDDARKKKAFRENFQKLDKGIQKARERCAKCFQKYEKQCLETYQHNVFYHKTQLNDILNQIEQLEVQRLNMLKHFLVKLQGLAEQFGQTIHEGHSRVKESVEKLSSQNQIKSYVDHMTKVFGKAPEIKPSPIQLPCSSEVVVRDIYATNELNELLALDVEKAIADYEKKTTTAKKEREEKLAVNALESGTVATSRRGKRFRLDDSITRKILSDDGTGSPAETSMLGSSVDPLSPLAERDIDDLELEDSLKSLPPPPTPPPPPPMSLIQELEEESGLSPSPAGVDEPSPVLNTVASSSSDLSARSDISGSPGQSVDGLLSSASTDSFSASVTPQSPAKEAPSSPTSPYVLSNTFPLPSSSSSLSSSTSSSSTSNSFSSTSLTSSSTSSTSSSASLASSSPSSQSLTIETRGGVPPSGACGSDFTTASNNQIGSDVVSFRSPSSSIDYTTSPQTSARSSPSSSIVSSVRSSPSQSAATPTSISHTHGLGEEHSFEGKEIENRPRASKVGGDGDPPDINSGSTDDGPQEVISPRAPPPVPEAFLRKNLPLPDPKDTKGGSSFSFNQAPVKLTSAQAALIEQESPLTDKEEEFFAGFYELKSISQMASYFKQLQKHNRHKWHYVLRQHLVMGFEHSQQVRLIVQSEGWQSWIFPFMMDKLGSELPPEVEENLLNLTLMMIMKIYYRAFSLFQKEGEMHEFLEGSFTWLRNYCSWESEAVMFARLILWMFINQLGAKLQKAVLTDAADPIWKNIFDVIHTTKQFVFYLPIQHPCLDVSNPIGGLHIDHRGWLDLPVVEKMMRLLEMLAKKLDGQLVDYSPQEEKDLCNRVVDDLEFFTLVYETFSPEPVPGAADRLQKFVEKKGGLYPYPTPTRVKTMIDSTPAVVGMSKSRQKFKALEKFASAQLAYKTTAMKLTPSSQHSRLQHPTPSISSSNLPTTPAVSSAGTLPIPASPARPTVSSASPASSPLRQPSGLSSRATASPVVSSVLRPAGSPLLSRVPHIQTTPSSAPTTTYGPLSPRSNNAS